MAPRVLTWHPPQKQQLATRTALTLPRLLGSEGSNRPNAVCCKHCRRATEVLAHRQQALHASSGYAVSLRALQPVFLLSFLSFGGAWLKNSLISIFSPVLGGIFNGYKYFGMVVWRKIDIKNMFWQLL
jgi:hypothetical protein